MEIKNTSPSPAPQTAAPQTATQQKATAHSLQVGQTLKAVVIESLKNSVKLRVDNTLLQAPTTKQHQSGEILTLTVVRTGEKPLLRVAPPPLLTTQQPRSVQNTTLKILLPKQAPLTPLLANLSAISQLKTQLASPLTPEVSSSVRKLIENITHTDKISDPKVLRQAILNSGILLEKKLSNLQQAQPATTPANKNSSTISQAQTVGQDFKANLVQLLGVLRQASAHQGSSSKIPLPLTTQGANTIPNTSSNTRQPNMAPNQSVKEQLLRLLSTPSNRSNSEETTRSTPPSRLADLTTSGSRIPVPFFRHLPLQPQKAQSPTLVTLQHRDQIIDELIRQSESSIARIQLSQLASMPQESSTSQLWAFELPLRHGENIDVVQLRIEKEDPKEDEEQDSRWRITLTLDLPAIGTIYATITVQGEQTSTTLWAEEENTAQLIDNNLQLLRDALSKHGVNSDQINCQHGAPPAPPRQQRHTLLVDTRA